MAFVEEPNICYRFVPHCLTDEQKASRLQDCREFNPCVGNDNSSVDAILTGDDTSCDRYNPQTRKQNMECLSPSNENTFQKAKNKVILTAFFDTHGIIHDEFAAPGQTVKKKYRLVWF
jgi:hypothetical protein